jgi:hypothetical protein
MNNLINLDEPLIRFKYDQDLEDPRDGLSIFGPLEKGKPYGIRAGVIGTPDGIKRYKRWVNKIQGPLFNNPLRVGRPAFPGFEAAFGIPWSSEPSHEIIMDESLLKRTLHLDDSHLRIFNVVDLYAHKIIDVIHQEDVAVDIWFVIVPDEVKTLCSPLSRVTFGEKIIAEDKMNAGYARRLKNEPSLFPQDNINSEPYYYELNFHNQLKARLLKYMVPTQVIRESTIAYKDFIKTNGKPKRDLEVMESAIAWSISTAVFYKTGGRPWKLSNIREGVCYIGLVFKKDDKDSNPANACCAAQMFLDSGDGVVFKGAVGPWQTEKSEFHLDKEAAYKLVSLAMESYKNIMKTPPKELFLHGRVKFADDEWQGFRNAADSSTNLVGVRIKDLETTRLYGLGALPILRGLAYVANDRMAYLWTRGFIPRLQSYPGREVPKALLIDICRGDAEINTVLNDIMALTKLNYNSCIFADGYPVTLKFADAVGEILTSGPIEKVPPLSFKYYI